jgi:CheY-like chemotaxis protein
MSLLPRATIQVIDGDDMAVAMIAEMLDVDGYRVLTTWNARTAWTLLLHNRVDLMICDTGLPDRSGVDFLAQLRDDPRLGAISCIFTSILSEPPSLTRQYQGFLAKPFHIDDLLRLVAAVLARSLVWLEQIEKLPWDSLGVDGTRWTNSYRVLVGDSNGGAMPHRHVLKWKVEFIRFEH